MWNYAHDPVAIFIFAHGASQGMDSEFMKFFAINLSLNRITVGRFEFPYMATAKAK